MHTRNTTKLVHVGDYVVEVQVQLIFDETEWAPYLTLEDANKLDAARQALAREDLEEAQQLGRLFKLTPVTA